MKNPFAFARFFDAASRFSLPKVISFLYHLPNFMRLYFRLLHDSRVPFYLKALSYGSFIYFFSPIDLMKDFTIPPFGYLDDIAILMLAYRKMMTEAPPEVIHEHVLELSKDEDTSNDESETE